MTWLPYYGAHLKLKEFVTEDLSHVLAGVRTAPVISKVWRHTRIIPDQSLPSIIVS